MRQILIGGSADEPLTTGTDYSPVSGFVAMDPNGAEDVSQVVACPGRLSNLQIQLENAPGAGNSRTVTLYVNGIATSVTVTIVDDNTTGADTVHSVAVSEIDTISLQWVGAGASPSGTVQWSMDFESDNERQSLLLGGGDDDPPSGAAVNYNRVQGGLAWDTLESDVESVVPTAGTIKNLAAVVTVAPGVGKSWTFKLRKNGADTALEVTISDGDVSNSTAVNVPVVRGDILTLSSEPANSPAATIASWGLTFESESDGESIVMGNDDANLSPTADTIEYVPLVGTLSGWNDIETDRQQLSGRKAVYKDLIVKLGTNPGAGKGWAFTLRSDEADTVLSVTVSDAETEDYNSEDQVTVDAGSSVSIKAETLPGGGVFTDARWGMVQYVADKGHKLVFDGINKHGESGSNTGWGNPPFTFAMVEAHGYPTVSGSPFFFQKGDVWLQMGYWGRQLNWKYQEGGGDRVLAYTPIGMKFCDGSPHLVIVRMDEDGTTEILWDDNSEVVAPWTDGSPDENPTEGSHTFLAARSTPDSYFDGSIDYIAVWNRYLTDDECADLYNSGAFRHVGPGRKFPSTNVNMGDNLIHCWNMNEGSGITVSDKGSIGEDITLVNMDDADWGYGNVLVSPRMIEMSFCDESGDPVSYETWRNYKASGASLVGLETIVVGAGEVKVYSRFTGICHGYDAADSPYLFEVNVTGDQDDTGSILPEHVEYDGYHKLFVSRAETLAEHNRVVDAITNGDPL